MEIVWEGFEGKWNIPTMNDSIIEGLRKLKQSLWIIVRAWDTMELKLIFDQNWLTMMVRYNDVLQGRRKFPSSEHWKEIFSWNVMWIYLGKEKLINVKFVIESDQELRGKTAA